MSLENQPKITPSTDKEWMEYYRRQLAVVERELAKVTERKQHYQTLLGEERSKSIDARMQDAADFMTAMVLKQKMFIVNLENKVRQLQEAMVIYGCHKGYCDINFISDSECSCGFSQFLKQPEYTDDEN